MGGFLREAVKATGYITIYREEFDGTLLISKGHMFKTLPDINGREYKILCGRGYRDRCWRTGWKSIS